jgi:ergosteryl-3beta-O-L-aspartate synthase
MPGLRDAFSKLHIKVRKAKDQVYHSEDSLTNGIHKAKDGAAKATRGGLERDVKAKIAEVETPPSESGESTRDSKSGRKDLEDFEAADEPADLRERYGRLPLVQSREEQQDKWTPLPSISPEMVDQNVTFRARLHTLRRMSPRLVFLVFREQLTTVQGVLQAEEGRISEHMVRWTEHIRSGSLLLVTGEVQRPVQDITGTSIHDAEILIDRLHVVSERTDPVPFSVYDAEVTIPDAPEISDRTRFANRVLDLRTPTSQSIFRIQSGVCSLFRDFLDSNGFIEIHTSKLQGGATEGGSSVFKLDYFGRPAFLAQSPQLAKQMCISADFGRVYEIGPVFRAGRFPQINSKLGVLANQIGLQRIPIHHGI